MKNADDVEQRWEEGDQDELGRQLELGEAGDEAEREPAEHEQDRVRDAEERREHEERGHPDEQPRQLPRAPPSAAPRWDDRSASPCGGICGIARRNGAAERAELEAMAATLEHRGPDSDGFLVDGEVGLGARRLSIIDLEGGDQPIANEDGTVHVVQNGEIYNHEELRVELERAGHRFRTRCDTEVLVHAYEEWGDTFARRLRGMFAIAILDAPRSAARASRATRSGSSRSTTASTATGCASRRSCARCRAARSTRTRSRRSSRSTRSRRR